MRCTYRIEDNTQNTFFKQDNLVEYTENIDVLIQGRDYETSSLSSIHIVPNMILQRIVISYMQYSYSIGELGMCPIYTQRSCVIS